MECGGRECEWSVEGGSVNGVWREGVGGKKRGSEE